MEKNQEPLVGDQFIRPQRYFVPISDTERVIVTIEPNFDAAAITALYREHHGEPEPEADE